MFIICCQIKANPQGWLRWSSHLVRNGRALSPWLILLIWRASRRGSQARLRSATAVRLQYSDVMHAPFLQATIWILYLTVPSHTINLPVVFMSLSILKGYMGCKHSWCPSEISLLIILGYSNVREEKGVTMQRGALSNLMHAILLCSSMCVCVCVSVWVLHAKWWFVDKNSLLLLKHGHVLLSRWRATEGNKDSQSESWVVQQSVSTVRSIF